MGVIPRNYAKLLGEMGSWSQPKLTRLRNRPARTGKVTMAAEDAGSQPVKKWHEYCSCPTMCACEGDDEYNPNDPWTFCQKITTRSGFVKGFQALLLAGNYPNYSGLGVISRNSSLLPP